MSYLNNSNQVSQHISQITREKNDSCFVDQYIRQNKKNMKWNIYNTREAPCDKKVFKTFDNYYLHQGVSPGYVNNCKVNTDSKLRQGQLTQRPVDNLAESVDKSLPFYYLAKTNSNKTALLPNYRDNNASMLVSTTVSEHPQFHLNPNFDRIGVSTRDYDRKNSLYYKNQKGPLPAEKTAGQYGRWSQW
jgi:hypothetical protein